MIINKDSSLKKLDQLFIVIVVIFKCNLPARIGDCWVLGVLQDLMAKTFYRCKKWGRSFLTRVSMLSPISKFCDDKGEWDDFNIGLHMSKILASGT